MASIWQRPDTGTYYVLHGKTGRIRVGKDKKSAKFLADKINVEEAERRAGLIPKEENRYIRKHSIESIEGFFAEYKEYSRVNHRPSTSKRYASIISNFKDFLKKSYPNIINLEQLEPLIFEKYKIHRKTTPINRNGSPVTKKQLKRKRPGKNLQPCARDKTVNVELEILKTIFKYALEKGFVAKKFVESHWLRMTKLRVLLRVLSQNRDSASRVSLC